MSVKRSHQDGQRHPLHAIKTLLLRHGPLDKTEIGVALLIPESRALRAMDSLRRRGIIVPRPDPCFANQPLAESRWGLRHPLEKRCTIPIVAEVTAASRR